MITVSAFTFTLVCGVIIALGAKAGHLDNQQAAALKERMDAYHKRWADRAE